MHKCYQSWVATKQGEQGKQGIWDIHFSKQGIYQQQLQIYVLHKNLPPTQGNFKDLKIKEYIRDLVTTF